jgi:hypothetical protein
MSAIIIPAAISIGRITPVGSFAPDIRAITGTTASPKPLNPAIDIPITIATIRNSKRYPGVRSGFIERRNEVIRIFCQLWKGQIYKKKAQWYNSSKVQRLQVKGFKNAIITQIILFYNPYIY